jgi:hypothetical protein
MGNAVHAMDTINPMLGNDLPGMCFMGNFPGDTLSADIHGGNPADPFILLLSGVYQPVTHGPNLGPDVNLSDGSYTKTSIYPVFGIGGNQNHAIGTFYAQNGMPGTYCAYDLPGRGTMEMQFTSGGFTPHDDGAGGQFLEGTFELNIVAATGVFAGFAGGHNHMVDDLHVLANGKADEFCFCNITTYPFP